MAFEHTRMDHMRYGNLDNGLEVAAFMCLVDDYMSYVRANPMMNNTAWNNEKEMRTAAKFLNLVDDLVTWPIAKVMVPEFRVQISEYIVPDFQPMKAIMEGVQHRLRPPVPFTRMDLVPLYTEKAHFKKVSKYIELVAYTSQGKVIKTAETEAEVDKVLERLKNVLPTTLGVM